MRWNFPGQTSVGHGLGLAAVLSVGVFLHVYNFWVPELWIDEYATWWAVAGGRWGDVAQRVVERGGQSPLFYYLVKLSCDLLGTSALSLRLPSVTFGLGTLAIAYPLGRRILRDRWLALLALMAFAINHELIWYAQDARPYALAIFSTLLSFYFYVSLLDAERISHRFGHVVASTVAYYAHYLFAFVVVIQLVHLCLLRGRSWLSSRRWRLTWLAIALLCLPGAVQIISLFGRRADLAWLSQGTWGMQFQQAVAFLDPWVFSAVAFTVLVIGLKSRDDRLSPGESPRPSVLLVVWLVLPLACLGILPALFGVNLLHKRYVLFALPAALFVSAWLMGSVDRTRWTRWLPPFVFLALTFAWHLLPPRETSGTFSSRFTQGWSKAADFIRGSARTGDLVLFRTGFVEADLSGLPDLDPLIPSYIAWPLLAHLPPDHPCELVSLPYRVDDRTRPYLSAVERRAAARSRVWLVGMGDELQLTGQALVAGARLQVRARESFGDVTVVLLERAP